MAAVSVNVRRLQPFVGVENKQQVQNSGIPQAFRQRDPRTVVVPDVTFVSPPSDTHFGSNVTGVIMCVAKLTTLFMRPVFSHQAVAHPLNILP